MKRNRLSQAGIFTPRALLGLALCLVGLSLAFVSFAAPRSAGPLRVKGTDPAPNLRPIVSTSVANGVSPSVLQLPTAGPIVRTVAEEELPPVKPARDVPSDFVDPIVQHAVRGNAVEAMPATSANFEGMDQTEACGGCIPPDTTGAVGPSQYVQMTNSAFSVYAKNGARLSGPTAINQLFKSFPAGNTCRESNNGDPVVIYDQISDRWLLSQFGFLDVNAGPWHECIAISQGGDARGPYYIYDFQLSDKKFHDYPHIGHWPDGYYMTTHQFIPDGSGGFSYGGAAAIAFERDKMLNGQPAQMVLFDMGTLPAPYNTGYGGHLPSNLDGFTLPPPGSPNYFVEVDAANELGATPAAMKIWKFHVDWTTPANSTFGVNLQPNFTVPVADFSRPPCSVAGNRVYITGCVPQFGDPSQLDPIGDRLMYRVAYRNFGDHESLVLNHTVLVNANTQQVAPRWYEVRDPGGTPTLFQQSTFGPTGPTDVLSRWMASIAMDSGNNIAIGYSTSSPVNFPSIQYAGRLASDSINTLGQGEAVLQAGQNAQHGEAFAPQTGRWGDYTTMTVDPYDDCTFWYTNEYYPAADAGTPTSNWHTRIGSFKFPSCTPRPIGFLAGFVVDSNGNPIAGAKVTAGGYTAITSNGGGYQFSPLAPGTYTATASAPGYFPSSTGVSITNGNVTHQDFTLTRNEAEPTPAPVVPTILRNINPPMLNDPGTTINNNHYPVSWTPAESTTNLVGYVLEESTDYSVTLFDNADGSAMPGDAASPWTNGEMTSPWTQSTVFTHSMPFSYGVVAPDGGFTFGVDTPLTLKNNITINGSASSARLNFWSRYYNDPDDTGNVEVSTDNGTHWTNLLALNDAPMVPPADTRMQNQELDLSAYKGMPIKLRFRYSTGSLIYFFIRSTGWWVDDILVDSGTWTPVATVPANSTSTQIINRPTGHYYYRVRAMYADGSVTAYSNVQDIIVNAPNAPTLVKAGSRKVHNTTPYDIDLPLTGAAGVECRDPGSTHDHQVVFTFATQVNVTGNPKAMVTSGNGSVTNVTPSGNEVRVDLTGVTNGQLITVTLFGVSDGSNTGDVSAPMYVLAGDTNGDTRVNVGDTNYTKNASGQVTDGNNFRADVNLDGRINVADVNFVKAQAGFEQ